MARFPFIVGAGKTQARDFITVYVHTGNVEILHDGKWGSICDDEWDDLEAGVVCRQLGFNGAIKATTNGHFGQARSKTRYLLLFFHLQSLSFTVFHGAIADVTRATTSNKPFVYSADAFDFELSFV